MSDPPCQEINVIILIMENQAFLKLDQFFNAFDNLTGQIIYGNSIEFMEFFKRKMNLINWTNIEIMNLRLFFCQYVSSKK